MCRRLVALVLAVAIAASCASDSKPAAHVPSSSSAPTASKIVSLSATATEMLFAIDAGAQVVAADDQSNYPAQAPKTDLSGLTPNVEAIAGYHPDLVVIANDTAGLVSGLQNLHIETLVLPAAKTLDEAYAQITTLGDRTGHSSTATQLVNKMKTDIDGLEKQVGTQSSPKTYYYELDQTYFTATSTTFIGAVIGLTGLENIGDAADDGSGYPQLSAEKIIQESPDVIFLADTKCCGQSKATVEQRPGWSTINAVKKGKVVELDDDVASRWGPRIVDLFRQIVEALKA